MDAPAAFGTLNLVVLVGYLLAMVAIGIACHKRVTSARAFFIAEGKLNHVLVGLSLLGTYLSAITMMALPGNSFGDADWTYIVQPPFLLVTALVITRYVLPKYREAGVISVYQFLEHRIHVSARLLASGSFVIFSLARMGLVLFLPALALSTLTGLSIESMILMMGVVTTLYCIVGGFEAVVWTDAIQVVVFILAALASVAYALAAAGADFLPIAMEAGKFRIYEPIGGVAGLYKVTTWWLILETLVQTIRIYGTQQDMTQRFVATESTDKAIRSVWISILGYIPLAFIFYFIGTALFVYYQIHPTTLPEKPDAIYPFFVMQKLPPGVAGLVIAGLFAASMSTISSLMNSSSTVCVEDFYRRFSRRERPDEHYLSVARWLTAGWGVFHIVVAFALIGSDAALPVWQKIMGIFTNGVLGLMVLAFLPRRCHRAAAVAGFVISYLVLFSMMFVTKPWLLPALKVVFGPYVGLAAVAGVFCWKGWRRPLAAAACVAVCGLLLGTFIRLDKPITFLLWPVIGNLTCILVGVLLTHALPPDEPRVETP